MRRLRASTADNETGASPARRVRSRTLLLSEGPPGSRRAGAPRRSASLSRAPSSRLSSCASRRACAASSPLPVRATRRAVFRSCSRRASFAQMPSGSEPSSSARPATIAAARWSASARSRASRFASERPQDRTSAASTQRDINPLLHRHHLLSNGPGAYKGELDHSNRAAAVAARLGVGERPVANDSGGDRVTAGAPLRPTGHAHTCGESSRAHLAARSMRRIGGTRPRLALVAELATAASRCGGLSHPASHATKKSR
jgi:hypothetical protein